MDSFKVLIIGAGLQGAATASILSRDTDVSEIILGDINCELAVKVRDKIGIGNITPVKLDASKKDEIIEYAKGTDVIVNMSLPRFNLTIMRASLEAGVHYVDAASGPDYELHPIDYLVRQQLKLDEEYKSREVTALISTGFTPGLSNVIARYVCDMLEEVDSIRFRVGGVSFGRDTPDILKPIHRYMEILSPTWSPEVSFLYRATEPVVYKDGRYVRYPPFAELEEYEFPPPVGKCLNVLVDHEEPVTIPIYIGKGVNYVDYKNPPDIFAYGLIQLGFAEDKPIKIGDIKVVPRDVLLKLLKPPVNHFLEEDEEKLSDPDYPVHCETMVIEVEGRDEKGVVKHKAVYKIYIPPKTPEERIKLYEKLGTTLIPVALPSAIGAKMIVKEPIPGVIAPEALDPNDFFRYMREKGNPVNLRIHTFREETL